MGEPFAENVYYSLVLRIDGGMRQLEGLSLVVGLAVMQTLREFGIADAGLKWPNDVLVGRKKSPASCWSWLGILLMSVMWFWV